jgi:hypothetical protein
MPVKAGRRARDVTKALDISPKMLHRWVERGVINMQASDVHNQGTGNPILYGDRTFTKTAITFEIAKLGVSAKVAAKLAGLFSDTPQHGRPIGGLFRIGKTYIVATDGAASVVNVLPEQDISSLLLDATLVININRIISKIGIK